MSCRLPEQVVKARETRGGVGSGFTLLELLVVIVIIGILASVGLPAIKGMTKSNAMIAANRQLLDDLAYARQRAIADHTFVYVVFVPNSINIPLPKSSADRTLLNVYTNIYNGQYNTYALLSLRSVGDQPGQNSPHYLTAWRSLPNGVFFDTNKFGLYNSNTANEYIRAFPQIPQLKGGPVFPFPIVSTNTTSVAGLPFIEFDYEGKLASQLNEAIPLARGSIFYTKDVDGNVIADVLQTPAGNSTSVSNIIYIDWLTGRARVQRQEIQ